MQRAERSINIEMEWAQRLWERVFDLLPKFLPDFSTLPKKDFYWDLAPSEKIYREDHSPTPALGRIRDDLEFIEGMLHDRGGTFAAPALMLMHVVPIVILWSELVVVDEMDVLHSNIRSSSISTKKVQIIFDATNLIFDHIRNDLKITTFSIEKSQQKYLSICDPFDISMNKPEIVIRDIADDLNRLEQMLQNASRAELSQCLKSVAALLDMVCIIVRG